MPVAAFLGRVHFRIGLFISVFRRTRRFNKGAVHNRALAEEKTSVGKLPLKKIKDLLAQTVFLKKAAETQDRTLIRTF